MMKVAKHEIHTPGNFVQQQSDRINFLQIGLVVVPLNLDNEGLPQRFYALTFIQQLFIDLLIDMAGHVRGKPAADRKKTCKSVGQE
jgi:hypothetical protein